MPFYVYEFERISGYAVPLAVVERLRELAPNLAGLKVSDSPFEKVRPYLVDGLDVFVGAEALIGEGLAAGAAGAVSGLSSAFPDVVAEAVRTGDSQRAGELRALLDRYQRLAALKAVARLEGRAGPGGHARAAAAAVRRRAAEPLRRARGVLGAELVDRAAGAVVDFGAALVDGRRSRLRLGLGGCGLRLRCGAGLGEPGAQLVRGRGAPAVRDGRVGAATKQGPEAEGPGEQGEQALHGTDATLPQLLATPVAPSPEAAQGGGADSVHEKEEFGLERV